MTERLPEIDWQSADVARRVAGGRRQPLARACGVGSINPLRLLDATGGYGRDAFVLAALGAEVTLCERLPMLANALQQAHQRALESAAVADIAARMRIEPQDAIDWLPQTSAAFDVIYLDPMYAAPGQRARAKAPLETLRHLTDGDPDADHLANQAWEHARRRVVIKRAPKAPALLDRKVSYVLKSNRVRYDIYVRS